MKVLRLLVLISILFNLTNAQEEQQTEETIPMLQDRLEQINSELQDNIWIARYNNYLTYRKIEKELKKIKDELNNIFGTEIIPKKANAELAITEDYEMILIDNEPIAFKINDKVYPTLKTLLNHELDKGKVVVDMGAVKFLANGADVMAPGIVEADENIKEGDVVFVVDETHNRPLCVGEALMDGKTMKESNKGKAIKTIHYIGDDIWKF